MAVPAATAQATRRKVGEEIDAAALTVAQCRGAAGRHPVARAPNVAAVILAGLDPLTARRLSRGEVDHAREASGRRATALTAKAAISDGPGRNPIALGALINGNRAITIGNVTYYKPSHWKADFAAKQGNVPLFPHEFTPCDPMGSDGPCDVPAARPPGESGGQCGKDVRR